MTFQKTQPAPLFTPGVGGAARSNLKLAKLIFPTRICPNCGSVAGQPELPGNGWIEAILWISTVFLGLIYSVWRRTKKSRGCPTCGAPATIPLDTPAGKRLALEDHGGKVTPIQQPPPKPASLIVVVGAMLFGALMLYTMSH